MDKKQKTVISLRVDSGIKNALIAEAKTEGRNESDVMRDALFHYCFAKVLDDRLEYLFNMGDPTDLESFARFEKSLINLIEQRKRTLRLLDILVEQKARMDEFKRQAFKTPQMKKLYSELIA